MCPAWGNSGVVLGNFKSAPSSSKNSADFKKSTPTQFLDAGQKAAKLGALPSEFTKLAPTDLTAAIESSKKPPKPTRQSRLDMF